MVSSSNVCDPLHSFHNDGDWTFTVIGAAAGVAETGFAKGVTVADYDHDSYLDL